MRAKLLRALRHLKAAKLHLDEAGRLIRYCYVGGLEREAVDPVAAALKDGLAKVEARYASAVYDRVAPAELP